MKHLFSIHSPLTFFVAYSVIKHLKLDNNDVILITNSRYKVPIDIFPVYKGYQEVEHSWLDKIRNLNFPRNYDAYLDQILQGDSFIAYVDLLSYYQKIIITHVKCIHFNLLEEGNLTYQTVDDLDDLTWSERNNSFRVNGLFDQIRIKSIVRTLRGYNLRILSIPYLYSAFSNFKNIKFYSLSKNAFYNAPKQKKVFLKPLADDPEMLKMAGDMRLENDVIWVDGSNSRITGLTEDYYFNAVEKGIRKLKEKGIDRKRIYVKLRPGCEDGVLGSTLIKIIESHGFTAIVLPNNIVLESLFVISKKCIVIGTLSATLEYAYVFGHKAFSIYSLFEKQPPTVFDRMNGFWENVEKL